MGIEIGGADTGPCPRPTFLRMTCETCREVQVFDQDGYIAQRSAATRAGWRVTDLGKTYGPCCE